MKHFSLKTFVKTAVLVLILTISASTKSYACHGLPIVGLVADSNVITSPTGVTINGNSDAATCGCGPYYMEVEVSCSPTGFTGSAPTAASASWGTFPWYHSVLNAPSPNDACAPEAYFPLTIPYNTLCPGTRYYWRIRENPTGGGIVAGWSAVFSFTTPGSPPTLTASAAANQYVACIGNAVQLNATVTGGCPSTFFNYTWSPTNGLNNPNIPNPICTVPGPITYTCTVVSSCNNTTLSDTVGIVIGPPPVSGIASANPLSLCSGQSSTIVLQNSIGNIQWQMSPNGITWFNINNATNDTLITGPISTTLYYQAVVTGSGCGSATSNPIQITVNPQPNVSGGSNTTICLGSSTTLTGSGAASYVWNPGNTSSTSITVNPTGNTTYTVVGTDNNGCVDSSTVTVSISSITANAGPNVSICNGNGVTLFATGNGATTYNWLPNSGLSSTTIANPVANPSTTTTYTVTVGNSLGCTSVDSITVSVTPAPPTLASNDTTMCAGGIATLSATGATQYTWNPGNIVASSITVTPSSTTTYIVQGDNGGGCISYDTVTVNITPPPSVNVGPDFAICSGTNATLSASNGVSYLWQPGGQTTASIQVSPTTQTSYTVTVTGAGGCISTDVIQISVNPLPTVTATAANPSICAGNTTSLVATGAATYVWAPSTAVNNSTIANPTANPGSTTTYTVTGSDANGCINTATVTVNVVPNPQLGGIYSTPTVCGDTTGTIVLGAINGGQGPFTYTLNGNPVTPVNGVINGLTDGTYTVIVTDQLGCTSSPNTLALGWVNNAAVTATANPLYGVYPLTVTFGATGTSGVNDYNWNFGDQSNLAFGANQTHIYTQPGTYMIILNAYNDFQLCGAYDTIYVQVFEQAEIELPNVFTPNADGTNDIFIGTYKGVRQTHYQIFNRWGNLVADVTGDANTGWDGKGPNGNVLDDGTYYYILICTGFDDKTYENKGFVQLLSGK